MKSGCNLGACAVSKSSTQELIRVFFHEICSKSKLSLFKLWFSGGFTFSNFTEFSSEILSVFFATRSRFGPSHVTRADFGAAAKKQLSPNNRRGSGYKFPQDNRPRIFEVSRMQISPQTKRTTLIAAGDTNEKRNGGRMRPIFCTGELDGWTA